MTSMSSNQLDQGAVLEMADPRWRVASKVRGTTALTMHGLARVGLNRTCACLLHPCLICDRGSVGLE